MGSHLILGATGAFGSAILRELRRRGESVRVLLREPSPLPEEVELFVGDARVLSCVLEAAKDCQSIFQGIQVPLSRWMPDLVKAHENAVEASGLTGATLVFPGSLIGMRPIFGVPLPATSWEPMHLDGVNPFGRIRQDLEAQLQQNSELRQVRSFVLRSSDWFGPRVENPIVGPMFRAAKAGKPIPWLGKVSLPHLFVYVEDLARVAVDLLLLKERPMFEVWNLGGTLCSGDAWAEAMGKAAGFPGLKAKTVSSWGLRLQALWDAEAAWCQHHSHLWEGTMLLDDRATAAAVSVETTPLPVALQRSFQWMGATP